MRKGASACFSPQVRRQQSIFACQGDQAAVCSELAHEADFAAGAVVAIDLRVGVLFLMGEHELRTESVQREGAVVHGCTVDLGAVLARGAAGEGEPVALVAGPAKLGAAAHGKAARQEHRGTDATPAGIVAPHLGGRVLIEIAKSGLQAQGRHENPVAVQRDAQHRAVQVVGFPVFAVVPGSPPGQPQAAVQPMLDFRACTEVKVVGCGDKPAPARIEEQADAGVCIEKPFRAGMDTQEGLVILLARIFLACEIGAETQAQARCQGVPVAVPGPDGKPDS